jgi:hypothetical protein
MGSKRQRREIILATPLFRAFSAPRFLSHAYPGRWPGLLHVAPLALGALSA